MTERQIAGLAAAAFLALLLVGHAAYAVILHRRRRPARRAARRAHPSHLAAGLQREAVMPAGHPERAPAQDDSITVALAELHDRLWRDEEYLATIDCPHPQLTGYRTHADLREHEGAGVEPFACTCGLLHARRRRRRRRGASRTGVGRG
jgi:hypothetical protein